MEVCDTFYKRVIWLFENVNASTQVLILHFEYTNFVTCGIVNKIAHCYACVYLVQCACVFVYGIVVIPQNHNVRFNENEIKLDAVVFDNINVLQPGV